MQTIKESMVGMANSCTHLAEKAERSAAHHMQQATRDSNEAIDLRKKAAEWTRLANERADAP